MRRLWEGSAYATSYGQALDDPWCQLAASCVGQDGPTDTFQTLRFLSPGGFVVSLCLWEVGGGRTKTIMGGEKSLCPQGNDCTFPGPAPHPGWLLWGWVSLLERHWGIWASGPRGSEDQLEENCPGILGQKPHTKVPGYPLAQVCPPDPIPAFPTLATPFLPSSH